MKKEVKFMVFKSKFIASLFVAVLLAVGTTPALAGEAAAQDSVTRIGTFDSRALMAQYLDSDEFESKLQLKLEALEGAEEEGLEAVLKQLQAIGTEIGMAVQKHGFSAPHQHVLNKLEADLPAIAEEAGVALIVSEDAVAYLGSGYETVDLTDVIVEKLFMKLGSEKSHKHEYRADEKHQCDHEGCSGGAECSKHGGAEQNQK